MKKKIIMGFLIMTLLNSFNLYSFKNSLVADEKPPKVYIIEKIKTI